MFDKAMESRRSYQEKAWWVFTWNKWNDTSREVYEMFKTPDTGALKQDKKCQVFWYIILSTMSGSTTGNNPLWYTANNRNVGSATAADSIGDTFHPTFLPQQAVVGTSQCSANPIYSHVDVSQTFANPTYRPMQITNDQINQSGLSPEKILKIRELKPTDEQIFSLSYKSG
jgi:hypothetical protein